MLAPVFAIQFWKLMDTFFLLIVIVLVVVEKPSEVTFGEYASID
jgi:hypothetical protein